MTINWLWQFDLLEGQMNADAKSRGKQGVRTVARKQILPIIGVLALISGCANLQAVNTVSGQLVSAASSWDAVADQFNASCVRRNQVSDVPSDCASEKQATASLEAADKILSAYFTALQEVSNGGKFSIDPGIAAVGTSAQAIRGANPNQVQAISAFATFLADAATLTLRERTLKRLIDDGAPKAIATVDVLHDVVAVELKRILDREDSQMLATFSGFIQQSGVKATLADVKCSDGPVTRAFSTGDAFLLAGAYCSRTLITAQQRAALDNYKSSLATTKLALKELQDGKDNLSAVATIQQLVTQASSLKNDIEKIEKAF